VFLRDVAEVEGLFCLLTEQIDAEMLNAAPHLKVVSNMAVGYDNVDVAECTRRNIPVGNTPGVLTETTADLAWALMMAAARRIVEGADYVRAGRWTTWGPLLLLGPDVYGSTLGIFGFGRIGQAMARRARGFGMRILYYDRYRSMDVEQECGVTFVDFDTLLRESDFLTIHASLTPETRHIVDDEALSKMKPGAVLVNAARGPIVDPQALYETLKANRIFAAALDVTEPEPLPADHPLLNLPNCLVVPHIGSASIGARGKMASIAAHNLLAGLRNERLPHCVNPVVYEE
jgi:glyoxylate reductase